MKTIVAVDNNWAIGYKNDLLVKIPNDQKNFRKITSGHVVVLGRRTLEGFPNGLPLVNRTNIILSRNPSFQVRGGIVVRDMDALKEELKKYDTDDIFVIGGESIYKALVPYCDEAFVTKIDYSYQADSYFPNLDKLPEWEMVEEGEEETCFSIEYTFRRYINNSPQRFV
ncbi:MAG: dihydrofolate reductase [Eubacterium sp.]|nr:dihydrofolate reductase [Eubacterium sp.]SEF51075.1 dihydrofolate reductase [Eubacterium ruminantium]